MPKLRKVRDFCLQEDGVTSIEYSMLAVLIAVAIIGAGSTLGQEVQSNYEFVRDQISAALS